MAGMDSRDAAEVGGTPYARWRQGGLACRPFWRAQRRLTEAGCAVRFLQETSRKMTSIVLVQIFAMAETTVLLSRWTRSRSASALVLSASSIMALHGGVKARLCLSIRQLPVPFILENN